MSNNSSPFHSVPMLLVCTAIVAALGLKISWVFEVAGWPGALVGLLAIPLGIVIVNSIGLNKAMAQRKALENAKQQSLAKGVSSTEHLEIQVRKGDVFPLNRRQQVWFGSEPTVMQTALFAGQEMWVITDDAGAYELGYMGHFVGGFASIEDAKAAAPLFARAVLARMGNLVQDA